MWGQGVQRLLKAYPHAPVLGLSAAAVRRLDGQRDVADGPDVVFNRRMEKRTGKYLVFCANVQHMAQLLSCCHDWFHLDPKPHIYKAWPDNPETSQSFADFKAAPHNVIFRGRLGEYKYCDMEAVIDAAFDRAETEL